MSSRMSEGSWRDRSLRPPAELSPQTRTPGRKQPRGSATKSAPAEELTAQNKKSRRGPKSQGGATEVDGRPGKTRGPNNPGRAPGIGAARPKSTATGCAPRTGETGGSGVPGRGGRPPPPRVRARRWAQEEPGAERRGGLLRGSRPYVPLARGRWGPLGVEFQRDGFKMPYSNEPGGVPGRTTQVAGPGTRRRSVRRVGRDRRGDPNDGTARHGVCGRPEQV